MVPFGSLISMGEGGGEGGGIGTAKKAMSYICYIFFSSNLHVCNLIGTTVIFLIIGEEIKKYVLLYQHFVEIH